MLSVVFAAAAVACTMRGVLSVSCCVVLCFVVLCGCVVLCCDNTVRRAESPTWARFFRSRIPECHRRLSRHHCGCES